MNERIIEQTQKTAIDLNETQHLVDMNRILEQADAFSDKEKEERMSMLCEILLIEFKQMTDVEFKAHLKDLLIDKKNHEYILHLSFKFKN